jgi:hypothetical protein
MILKNSKSIELIDGYDYFDQSSFMSSIIPKLSRCDAKYIYFHNQNLSFNELKFLIHHGKVIELKLKNCKIKDVNDELVDVEKIMAYLPNITKIRLSHIKFNKHTVHALTNQNFLAKIHYIKFMHVTGEPFDSNEFLKFCVANRDEKFKLKLNFNQEFDDNFLQKFMGIMEIYEKSNTNTKIIFCQRDASDEFDL